MERRLYLAKSSDDTLSKRQRCKLLGVNRSSLYYKPQPLISQEDQELMQEIQEIYAQRPCLGYRRIGYFLWLKGYVVNNKRVLRLMRQMGLQAIYPKRNLSKRRQGDAVFPYLLRLNPPQRANDAWSVDITYIKTSVGWIYLVALIDVVSRRIMGFDISPFLETTSALKALEIAIKTGYLPKIINTDQGCQFTSQVWVGRLLELQIDISMNGQGRCVDNILIERFWRTIKYEEVYLKTYDSIKEARIEIEAYIDWYNEVRPHQSLGYQTPNAVFEAHIEYEERNQRLANPKVPSSDSSSLSDSMKEEKQGDLLSLKNTA